MIYFNIFSIRKHFKLSDEKIMKARFSYLTGFVLVLSGILIGTAGIVWATHLTREYENGIFVNALDSLNLSGNHYV